MVDKDKSLSELNEYKFDDAEAASSYVPDQHLQDSLSEVPSPAGSSMKIIKFARIIAVFAAVVSCAYFAYWGFSFYADKKSRSIEQQKTASQDRVAVIQQPMVPSAETAVTTSTIPAPVPLSVSPVDNGLSKQQMEQIQSRLNEAMQRISDNHTKISNLSDTISKVQQDISDINKNIDQLSGDMQKTLAEIKRLRAPKIVKKKSSKPLVAYHVRAIVQGRVWLESADGKSITLRVGDKLDGYGTVDVIAPRQGMVLMSNGSVIQYGINDF